MSVKPRATLSKSALSIKVGQPCYRTAIRSFHSRAEWTVFEQSRVVPACSYQAEVFFTKSTSGKRGLSLFWPRSSSKSYPGLTPHMWANLSTPRLGFLCAVILFRLMQALKGTGLTRVWITKRAHTQPYEGWQAVILHPHPPPLSRMDWNQWEDLLNIKDLR